MQIAQWHFVSLRWRHNGRDCASYHQHHDCLLNRLFGRRSKLTSKLRVTGLCVGNSPGTGEFPAQMASNAENISIWWRHHVWHNSVKRNRYLEYIMARCLPIAVTSWAHWRHKSPSSRCVTQPFVQAHIEEYIKAPCHWPLWGGFNKNKNKNKKTLFRVGIYKTKQHEHQNGR